MHFVSSARSLPASVSLKFSFAKWHAKYLGNYNMFEEQFGAEAVPEYDKYEKGESIKINFPDDKTQRLYTVETVDGEDGEGKLIEVKDHFTNAIHKVEQSGKLGYQMAVQKDQFVNIDVRCSLQSSRSAWFKELYTDKGGGFGEIPALFTWIRLLLIIQPILMLGMNTYNICQNYSKADGISKMVRALRGNDQYKGKAETSQVGFTITGLIFPALLAEGREDDVIATIDFIWFLPLLGSLVFALIHAWALRPGDRPEGEKEQEEHRKREAKFYGLAVVIFARIVYLTSFSSMNVLHYATVSVILHDYKGVNAKLSSRVWFILSRLLCFVLGHDVFMAKLRIVSVDIQPGVPNLTALICGFGFINQVLGIVKWKNLVKERVLSFIFSGEDSKYQEHELANKAVWEATLIKHIFAYEMPKPEKNNDLGYPLKSRLYPWIHPFVFSLAVMLTFNDEDMQRLVLNNPKTHRQVPQSSSSKKLDSSSKKDD